MRRIAICLLFLTATPLLAEPPKNEWKKVSLKGSEAELMFPATPKDEALKDGRQVLLSGRGGTAVFFVRYSKFPQKISLEAKDVKAMLDSGRDSAAKRLNAKVLADKDIKLGKVPGRAIDLEVPKLGVYRTHIYVTPTKLYQVTVLGPKDFVDGADVKKFFASFKLKD
jgi:hypothetical protein